MAGYHNLNAIANAYLGSTAISAIYQGEALLWPHDDGPAPNISSIIQSATSNNVKSVTLDAAPTPGNYLLYMAGCYNINAAVDAADGWVLVATRDDAVSIYSRIAYREVQPGDGATFNALGSSTAETRGVAFLLEIDTDGADMDDVIAAAEIFWPPTYSSDPTPITVPDNDLGYLAISAPIVRQETIKISQTSAWYNVEYTNGLNVDDYAGLLSIANFPDNVGSITPGFSTNGVTFDSFSVLTVILHNTREYDVPEAVEKGEAWGTAFRKYRVNMQWANGSQFVSIRQLMLYDADDNNIVYNNARNDGAASAISTFSGSYAAENSMDFSQGYAVLFGWVNNGGNTNQWWKWTATTTVNLQSLTLRTARSEYTRMPYTFKVQYSDDDFVADVNDAYSSPAQAAWARNTTRQYWWDDVGDHKYWRILIQATQPGNDGYTSLGFVLWGDETSQGLIRSADSTSTMRTVLGVSSTKYDENSAGDEPFFNSSSVWVADSFATDVEPWLEAFLPGPIAITSIGMRNYEAERAPQRFTFQGYDYDTATWRDVLYINKQTGWAVNETRTFAPA